MSRLIILAITLLLGTSLVSHGNQATVTPSQTEATQNEQSQPVTNRDENSVRKLVKDFGKRLQMVSLSAPHDLVIKSMQENYGSFVSPTLLDKWRNDPAKALGRVVSSPWPDRIEVLTVEKIVESLYKVSGEIIEVTSTEKVNGGFAAKRPVILKVEKMNNHWLINEVMTSSYAAPQSVIYQDTQYGFAFSLPDSWKGYTIVTDTWQGQAIGDARTTETGPMFLIRHPQWTRPNPRQDIPIMIFTVAQWNSLQQEKFHIGAAPIGPSELGRNSRYVFALPARYNFAFPTGYEEVETILQNKLFGFRQGF